MGPVICCVDDTEGARAAVRAAQRLAAALGLELVLLHVEPHASAPGVSAAAGGHERLRDAEQQDAAELVERIAQEEGLPGDVRRLAITGSPVDRILAVCTEEGAELVVIGSRGRAGVRAALLGSVSSGVAASAPCPCLIVPPGATARPFLGE